ncbi:hypothetical protein GJ496_002635 [Pomphorhynchus laevis]|nr:hypothetical protein GJ496_002635 [Pomphorhynchus laevis]
MQRVHRRCQQTSSETSIEITVIDVSTPTSHTAAHTDQNTITCNLQKCSQCADSRRNFVATADSMVRKHGPNHGLPGSGHPGLELLMSGTSSNAHVSVEDDHSLLRGHSLRLKILVDNSRIGRRIPRKARLAIAAKFSVLINSVASVSH